MGGLVGIAYDTGDAFLKLIQCLMGRMPQRVNLIGRTYADTVEGKFFLFDLMNT